MHHLSPTDLTLFHLSNGFHMHYKSQLASCIMTIDQNKGKQYVVELRILQLRRLVLVPEIEQPLFAGNKPLTAWPRNMNRVGWLDQVSGSRESTRRPTWRLEAWQ